MSNKNELDKSKSGTFTSKLGTILANVVITCAAACLIAICMALTYRFVVWVL